MEIIGERAVFDNMRIVKYLNKRWYCGGDAGLRKERDESYKMCYYS